MNIKAQYCMVLDLDKCIGCHTCSIPCKHVWTSHKGAEYIWYNDVETKPGIGYPQQWEDNRKWNGGWIAEQGRLGLKAGNRLFKFMTIFWNKDLPALEHYYEPWTYDYDHLVNSPIRRHQPATRSRSLVSGEPIDLEWGPSWEDDLAGVQVNAHKDINFKGLDYKLYMQFKKVFMFHLPRLCEHCLNPACVASCPSGALYKREEDGIVLVDQKKCRGWRFCVSGCPYKKVYFNWHLGRAEKCIFCYPRTEVGRATLCSESCVGRIRYTGVVLYDADRLERAAAVEDDHQVYPNQTEVILNPQDKNVIAEARAAGIKDDFIRAAQDSPFYKLAVQWKVALPLHPEFRTMPMVWYVPPLSPVLSEMKDSSKPEIERMRIPLQYLANLLAAGDLRPVRRSLERMLALRAYMRSKRVEGKPDPSHLSKVGLTTEDADQMLHLLAVGRYEHRTVLPTTPKEYSGQDLHARQGRAGYASEALKPE
jgi:nitrate reductase beta subunit